ncbi:MAG TPA: alanine--tRNA ligase [Gaiellaceae bacterium]|jgi:alanyl-tRNA synthetase|nr:alanine--tRNA ligase [Gaiellaceae bacterium]
MQTSAELRAGYRAYFESKGHVFRPSASLVPRADDRSTLLTSAGMQPLMPYFLGREQPPAPLLTTVQKVFRTPDIDEVGLDGSHLTFFEMLGNFSFGQYFKEGAIELAWEFVFEHLKLDPERFWVSVFAGDAELGLGEDEVAYNKWRAIGQPTERLVLLPRAENFWSVGGPGPCGPDTEMYWDWGVEHGCGEPDCQPGCTRCERFLEFWNLVFMEYELHADGKLTPLPMQNVDTGMGVERTAAILQNVRTVYETDIYQAIMRWIAGQSGVAYGDSAEATKAHRILADHGRGMTFLAADGISPSNEGRGYVMRRIIRRAVQQGNRIGLEPPYLAHLADVVIEEMKSGHPELEEHRDEIHRILSAEEERFGQTLARGLRLFEEVAAKGGDIAGEEAFRLHDTYGFPLELTQELARERGLGVNDEEFTRLMEEQRARSRAAGSTAEFEVEGPRTRFVGYEKTDVLTAISALYDRRDGTFEAKLHESPFYASGGGQVSDIGTITHEESGAEATLLEALRLEGDDQVLVFEGSGFAEGDRVRAVVPWSHRFPTMANHTATHLLHKALQDVLGGHVRQAGSAVRPDKLRFDFTHPQQLTTDERVEIERRVNEKIFENIPVHAFVTPIDEARKLGAMMLFGEKYGEQVRVIEIDDYSRELCGGTHVRWTAEIGPFAILSESSVGAGARRIEAVTSGEGYALLHGARREVEELRRELQTAHKEARKPKAETAQADISIVENDGTVLLVETKALKGGPLRDLSDRLRRQEKTPGVIVGSVDDGRVYLVVNLDESLVGKGLDASRLVREIGRHIDGGGGGRPTLAEAGGKNPAGLRDALEAGKQAIAAALK